MYKYLIVFLCLYNINVKAQMDNDKIIYLYEIDNPNSNVTLLGYTDNIISIQDTDHCDENIYGYIYHSVIPLGDYEIDEQDNLLLFTDSSNSYAKKINKLLDKNKFDYLKTIKCQDGTLNIYVRKLEVEMVKKNNFINQNIPKDVFIVYLGSSYDKRIYYDIININKSMVLTEIERSTIDEWLNAYTHQYNK